MNVIEVQNPNILRFSQLGVGELFCHTNGARDNVYMKTQTIEGSGRYTYNSTYLRTGSVYSVEQDREVCRVKKVCITS